MRRNTFYLITLLALLFSLPACNKDRFLDAKPNSNIIIPETLDDMIKLLDNVQDFSPALPQLSCDDYYYPSLVDLQSASSVIERNAYTWESDLLNGQSKILDWNQAYKAVFYANVVIEQLEKSDSKLLNGQQGRNVLATALLKRASAFFELVQCFARSVDSNSMQQDPGIPLRLSANIDELKQRASVKESYDQVFSDIFRARDLTAVSYEPINRNRASKQAVYGLLARVYLSVRNYEKAGLYADSSLKLYNKLVDYNSLSKTSSSPLSTTNDELVYVINQVPTYNYTIPLILGATTPVDSNLYRMYASNDLRKEIFFRIASGLPVMKITYNGYVYPYTGITTSELYLIRSESAARMNNVSEAMQDLNTLLRTRWNNAAVYPEASAGNQTDALDLILTERRKELVWRGQRWYDLKRYNMHGANITLERMIDGVRYELPPNSPKYVMPIPDDEVLLSGVLQNER
ncbi:MAG: RagB/SusD family nutrient uptake outer membrane protein [Pseudobacter sp.]|uniref:RagB/SusD family nutrient uptake outer membrane protein n=1 Tax=Pseudobacter sp. TaxID=2045420 RepID=UPI003F7E93F0